MTSAINSDPPDMEPTGELRCLIVDDESPARNELRFLLASCPQAQVVGSAATAEEAGLLLAGVNYDIVFLDIRMPEVSGLELAERLREHPHPPQIIFTTAYPDYAVDAFELSAVDYLLKPISEARLNQAVARAAERIAAGGGAAPGESARTRAAEGPGRLPVQRGDHTIFVVETDVVAASAAHGYSYLHLSDERVLASYTLGELENRFSANFYRVHRSYLANLNRIAELRPDFKGGLVLLMDDTAQTQIPVARRQAQELRRRLGL